VSAAARTAAYAAAALLSAPILYHLWLGHGDQVALLADDFWHYALTARWFAAHGWPSFDGFTLTNGFHPLFFAGMAALVGLTGGLGPAFALSPGCSSRRAAPLAFRWAEGSRPVALRAALAARFIETTRMAARHGDDIACRSTCSCSSGWRSRSSRRGGRRTQVAVPAGAGAAGRAPVPSSLALGASCSRARPREASRRARVRCRRRARPLLAANLSPSAGLPVSGEPQLTDGPPGQPDPRPRLEPVGAGALGCRSGSACAVRTRGARFACSRWVRRLLAVTDCAAMVFY
jgi:hypothetical protein